MHFYGFYWNTLVIIRSFQEPLEVIFPRDSNRKSQQRFKDIDGDFKFRSFSLKYRMKPILGW